MHTCCFIIWVNILSECGFTLVLANVTVSEQSLLFGCHVTLKRRTKKIDFFTEKWKCLYSMCHFLYNDSSWINPITTYVPNLTLCVAKFLISQVPNSPKPLLLTEKTWIYFHFRSFIAGHCRSYCLCTRGLKFPHHTPVSHISDLDWLFEAKNPDLRCLNSAYSSFCTVKFKHRDFSVR